MEAILLFIPSAGDTVFGSSSSFHPGHCGSGSITMATTPHDLDSPISLSSGYCSDDDGDERAAVRRGGDCWMPSTVVERVPSAAQKSTRRHHLERGEDNGRQRHRRRQNGRHHHHTSHTKRSAGHEVALTDCLDPFRIVGVDDTFTVTDEGLRLPPLQVDPRLADCSDDDVTLICCVSDTEASNEAISALRKTTDIQGNESVDSNLMSRPVDTSSTSPLIDDIPFSVDSWLRNFVGDGRHGDCSATLQTSPKDGAFETVDKLDEVVGDRLLADLLLGQATYRATTSSVTRVAQHDARHLARSLDSTVTSCDTLMLYDSGTSGTSGSDGVPNTSDSATRHTREVIRPVGGAVFATNSDYTQHYSSAVKRARLDDVIAPITCNAGDDFGESRARKLSTVCSQESRDFISIKVTSSSPTSIVTSPMTSPCLPERCSQFSVVVLSERLDSLDDCNSNEDSKQCVTVVNAVVGPVTNSLSVSQPASINTFEQSHPIHTVTGVTAVAGDSCSRRGGDQRRRSLFLEAMLRSATKLDANRGSDVTSVVMKDGLPTMLVDCLSTASSSSSSTNQTTTSASEPGLLHRLLTGQVDEADIHVAGETMTSSAVSSTTALTSASKVSCTVLPTRRRLADSLSATSASQLFDELDNNKNTGDGIDEFDVYQLMTPSIDDITATIGIQDDYLESYMKELWTPDSVTLHNCNR